MYRVEGDAASHFLLSQFICFSLTRSAERMISPLLSFYFFVWGERVLSDSDRFSNWLRPPSTMPFKRFGTNRFFVFIIPVRIPYREGSICIGLGGRYLFFRFESTEGSDECLYWLQVPFGTGARDLAKKQPIPQFGCEPFSLVSSRVKKKKTVSIKRSFLK